MNSVLQTRGPVNAAGLIRAVWSKGERLSSLNHNNTKCYSTITVLGSIKYQTRTLWLPACLPSRNVPPPQTFAQIVQTSTTLSSFFPFLPFPQLTVARVALRDYWRTEASQASPTYIGSNCLHIWWTTMKGAHASPFSTSFPCGLTWARVKPYCRINTFRREYQDSFLHTMGVDIRHIFRIFLDIHIFLCNNSQFIAVKC